MVCPAAFDLGEHARVALLSVTEGEDKPAKYPTLFRSADVVLITKSDLADATAFARDVALGALEAIAPHAPVIELSSRTGAGLDHWYAWIEERRTTRAA
jgi:hydrogenase nickel incorporation protein HypB